MTEASQLSTAADWIRQSSSILIASGAGLSASAISPHYGVGLDYTSVAAFRRLYPRMTHVSTMRCMYDAIGKHDWTPELMWGYLFAHVDKCRYNWGATAVYQDLKALLTSKPMDSFVVTTNADGMFEQNQFVGHLDRCANRSVSFRT
jgi:NAD-dependent SIR2 family protein deacetylase